ncbi:MAG: hypothetical protein IH596_02820 [Bacteroidales bacterium]|nr:hypothetical protein [Bacteroidales bacterium]
MLMTVMLGEIGLPVEIRVMFIAAIFFSIAAFILSGFAAFLFYKFYQDTIKPIPVFNLDVKENSASLKVVNNGNTSFFIFNCLYSKEGKVSETIFDFLPQLHEEALYGMFMRGVVGKRLLPDQSFGIFDLDFSFLEGFLSHQQINEIRTSMDGMMVELFCRDIGKRYKTFTRITLEMIQ